MRLIVGDLELNCPLVAMIDLGECSKLKLRQSSEIVVKLPFL
jgi:hypothetical protein